MASSSADPVPPARTFVGREAELAVLTAAAVDARDGTGGCVLVTGDAGIGKSRLVDEAVASVAAPERVLRGRCHEPEGAPAYWPWTQALRAWVRRCPPDLLRAQVGDAGKDLARLVPGLGERLDAVLAPSLVEPEAARFRLFDVVATFLRRVAADELLVVILDDLQWADHESLLLTTFVAGELGRARLLLVATYRDVEMQDTAVGRRYLADLARVGTHLPLGGLAAPEVGRIVELVGSAPPSPALTETIHHVTGGNPFFVLEIAELVRAERRAGAGAAEALAMRLPETLRETIQRRADRLPAATRRVLTVAAVLGREVELAVLAAACDTTPEDTLALLEPALASGLLAAVPGQPGRLRFGHAILQHALVDELAAAERTGLHRRVGEAVERVYAGDLTPMLGELAYHFLHSADRPGLAKAAVYAARAGRRAMDALGFEEAAGHFERALQTERAAGGAAPARLELLLLFGKAQHLAGDDDGARATALEAARLARDLHLPAALAAAAMAYCAARAETGTADRTAITLLEEALAALAADAPARPDVLGLLASMLSSTPEIERREALSLEAIASARRGGDPRIVAAALLHRHVVLWRPGTAAERLALATEALGLDERALETVCEARARRILDLLELEEIEEADREIARHAESAERVKLPRYRWHATLTRGARALLAGRLEEAEALANAARAVRQARAADTAEPFFGVQTFFLRRVQGRLAEVADAFTDLAVREAAPPLWRCGAALLAAELARPDAARRLLDELAREGFAALPHDGNWLASLALLVEVSDLVGDAHAAARLYELMAPHADVSVVLGTCAALLGPVTRYLGVAALVEGRARAAAAHFESAIARCRRLGAPVEEARSALGLARALEAEGDAGQAAALRHETAATVARLGLVGLLAPARSGAAPVAPAASTGAARRASLRREGDYWTLRCGNEVTRLKDSRGFAYLDTLLRHPGEEFHALDLAGGTVGARTRGGDAGEALDADARRAYRGRVAEIQAALAAGDAPGAEGLRAELTALERELARGTAMGGRLRPAGSDAERARVNVTRALAKIVRRIRADCPLLGRHLEGAVRTGAFCRYEPDLVFPVVWER